MDVARFSRQIAFLGKDAQEKLENSSVGIVGIGGLGTVVAGLLCRMGVGKLVLLDNDVVAGHNLPRQSLFDEVDVSLSKVEAAKHHLNNINSACHIQTHNNRVQDVNNLDMCKNVDLLIDCTDNHATRLIIDAFARESELPWVHGAAIQDKGLVCLFHPLHKPLTHYDVVYNGKTSNEQCDVSGVLATTTHLVGTLQVQLAINFITKNEISSKCYRVNASDLSITSFEVE